MKHVLLLAITLGASSLTACNRHPATPDECDEILDRIVGLELHELGYRDPALAERKATELRRTLSAQLDQCKNVRIRDRSMPCVRAATTTEEISHRCLR